MRRRRGRGKGQYLRRPPRGMCRGRRCGASQRRLAPAQQQDSAVVRAMECGEKLEKLKQVVVFCCCLAESALCALASCLSKGVLSTSTFPFSSHFPRAFTQPASSPSLPQRDGVYRGCGGGPAVKDARPAVARGRARGKAAAPRCCGAVSTSEGRAPSEPDQQPADVVRAERAGGPA